MRSRLALISMSVLSLALASAPCMAATTAKTKTAASASLKAKPLSSEPASAKPAAKITKSADSKKTTVAAATDKPAKTTTKTTAKAGAKPAKATVLADADDTSARKTATKKTAKDADKTTQVADSSTKKITKSVKTGTKLAAATPPKAKAPPKPVEVAAADPAPEPPVIMNAAPVPYGLVKAEAPRTPAVPLDTPLSAADAALYRTAFDQIDSGEYDAAEATLAQVSNRSLMGYAEFHKLFSKGYESTYDELISWLNAYGDQPMAMRVWGLAKRKKPDDAPDPAFPSLGRVNSQINGLSGPQALAIADSGAAVQLAGYTTLSDSTPVQSAVLTGPTLDPVDNDLTPKSARSAYNNGQLEQAVSLGRKIGDHWVAGLALWRLGRVDQAETEFKFVSTDPSRNAWSQSAGAYWAGRCALRQGRKGDAETYFKIAASFPFTFYGLVAEARLGVVPAVTKALKGEAPTFTDDSRDALTASLDSDFAWARSDVKAERLNALIQIGRTADAQAELQTAIQTAADGTDRDKWLALAAKTNVPVSQLKPTDRLFDPTRYPIPDFKPKGGYTVDKALVYAFARKESKFNPNAYSYSGAYGLLQLMPGTAALVEGDSSFTSKPKQLLKPEINLSVGQHYIQRLSDSQIVSGDLLRTIAAYNAGPRPVKDALDSLGDNADSLLVMESIPVAQTRQYVEEVAANYWIYRQLMGESSKTLAMAANDARIIDASADQ